MFEYNFSQALLDTINKWWILIDTCYTCNVTNNPSLLTSLQHCPPQEQLQVVPNGGGMLFEQKGQMKLFPLEVHYNQKSIATILSFHTLSKLAGLRIVYDNLVNDVIHVILPNGFSLDFNPCDKGLYYLDSSKLDLNNVFQHQNFHLNLLSTVSQNKQYWTKREIQGAEEARKLQEHLSWPGTSTLKSYLQRNLINNTSITPDDVGRATAIFGPPEPLCKGTMTRHKPNHHDIHRIPLSPFISDQHKTVQLYVDFIFVNKLPFLITISDKIKYRTIQYASATNKSTILSLLSKVIQRYKSRGLQVTTIHADNQFDITSLHEALLPINVEIYATNEHVAPIERQIRTTKERTRCTCHAAPYRKYPKIMTIIY